MDLGIVGWIALGWFAVALVLSLALGGFLRKVNETPGENDLAVTVSQQKVMRFMRDLKPTNVRCNAVTSRVRELGRRATG
jgi:hypothetical protein